MVHELKVPEGWVCTDPDNFQFRRDNEDGSFTFRELDMQTIKNSIYEVPKYLHIVWNIKTDYWKKGTIFLTDYSRREIKECLLTFYTEKQIEEIADIDNPKHHALIAEHLFELEMYDE